MRRQSSFPTERRLIRLTAVGTFSSGRRPGRSDPLNASAQTVYKQPGTGASFTNVPPPISFPTPVKRPRNSRKKPDKTSKVYIYKCYLQMIKNMLKYNYIQLVVFQSEMTQYMVNAV
jgi:hypothetical protein